jgi:uncharacterized protein
MRILQSLAIIITIIGGINWILIGFINVNLVSKLFGVNSIIEHIIYGLFGIACLSHLIFLFIRNNIKNN